MDTGKRKYYRLTIESPCVFQIIRGKNPEEKSPPFEGMLKDISLGGFQFGTNVLNHGNLYIFNEFEIQQDQEFKPNVLLIEFPLPGEKEPFTVYCQPRWYGQGDLSDPFEYQIGVKYIPARKEDILRVRDYIQKHGDKEDLLKHSQRRKDAERKKGLKAEAAKIQSSKYAVAALPLRYKIISGQSGKRSRSIEAVTRNISVTGICARVEAMDIDDLNMVFDETPTKRNFILLEIVIPDQSKPLTIRGEVRWFERSTSEDKYNYNVGIKFLKISEKDKSIITEYIKDKPEDVTGPRRVW